MEIAGICLLLAATIQRDHGEERQKGVCALSPEAAFVRSYFISIGAGFRPGVEFPASGAPDWELFPRLLVTEFYMPVQQFGALPGLSMSLTYKLSRP